MKWRWNQLVVMLPLLVAGCAGNHSALDPAGPQAGRISKLYWLYFGVCVFVWVAVAVVALVGTFRRRVKDHGEQLTVERTEPARERRLGIIVSVLVGITVVILFVLLIGDYYTGRKLHQFSGQSDFVAITVTGHQWWWEVRYDDQETPSNTIVTANEIVIPTGKPVKIWLVSGDVIHSFWVPNLQGKKDLIPGHSTAIWLQADKDGKYEGQCAEFCGYEHAMMRLIVRAESPDEFVAWLRSARTPAAEPLTEQQKRGRDVFMRSSCVMCHAVAGTKAGARLGPNLTHLASRMSLAAGSIPNVTGHMAGWIIDPQRVKPGVKMPQNNLESQDFTALVEWLSSLK
jgi:cytochrome c oxidase subunit 2